MTLTFPRIERSRAILWLVTGAEKQGALARMLAHDPGVPAGRVSHADQVVFADAGAGGN